MFCLAPRSYLCYLRLLVCVCKAQNLAPPCDADWSSDQISRHTETHHEPAHRRPYVAPTAIARRRRQQPPSAQQHKECMRAPPGAASMPPTPLPRLRATWSGVVAVTRCHQRRVQARAPARHHVRDLCEIIDACAGWPSMLRSSSGCLLGERRYERRPIPKLRDTAPSHNSQGDTCPRSLFHVVEAAYSYALALRFVALATRRLHLRLVPCCC